MAAATATSLAVRSFAERAERGQRPESPALRPTLDRSTGEPLLNLPPGFSYSTFSWSLETMDDGNIVSGLHDGMGAFPDADGRIVHLVRNHEITLAPLLGRDAVYDPRCGGGTTTLSFDIERGEWLSSRTSLAGTYRNCAGGPTPWGSWLSCEETLADPSTEAVERPHGYVFDVPATGMGDPRPITALGRFQHEAAAVDASTGIVYLTEDERRAGLYRFVPPADAPLGALRDGGSLQMLAIEGRPNYRGLWSPGLTLPVAWVPIDNPLAEGGQSTFSQGYAGGGLRFKRLEGCWLDGGRLYFVSTSGGLVGKGQIWELDVAADRLRLLYESPGRSGIDRPDNVTVMADGSLLLCEEGDAPTRLRMLRTSGELVTVSENALVLNGLKGFSGDFRRSEWCGACCFGDYVFVNIQTPGITFAITGPWQELQAAS